MKSKLRAQLPKILICLAALVLLAGAGVAYYQWCSNKTVRLQASKQQYAANHGQATGSNPSTVGPSWDALESYQVPADQPRYLRIPSIGVTARVYPVGLTSTGAIGSPTNVYDTAWYTGSAKPGQKGATFIDGHVSSWTTKGVFYNLKNLRPGDHLQITLGNGDNINYKVVSKKYYPSGKVDMKQVLAPIDPLKSGLNLMTCAGQVEPGTSQFDQRVAIFAEQDS